MLSSTFCILHPHATAILGLGAQIGSKWASPAEQGDWSLSVVLTTRMWASDFAFETFKHHVMSITNNRPVLQACSWGSPRCFPEGRQLYSSHLHIVCLHQHFMPISRQRHSSSYHVQIELAFSSRMWYTVYMKRVCA